MSNVIIIAEAGVNHNGNIENAYRLIDVAVESGANYVKFQTFKTEKLTSINAKKANYQIENTKVTNESQFEMLKKVELSESDHKLLINYCRSKNIKFFSTAFDIESLVFLSTLELDFVKIPSGEITNLPYIKMASKLFKKVILSTGMATIKEIGDAIDIIQGEGVSINNITVLHCNTEYPTPMKDVNLLAMLDIKKKFNVNIGYSDHTLGVEIPIAAVALGAKIIEKHFTLDRNMNGPDHAASLEPIELKKMVESIRNIELAISGTGFKSPTTSELKNIMIARKSIHLVKAKLKGEIILETDVEMLRPGDGISPMMLSTIIGRKVNKDLPNYYKLLETDLE